MNNEDQALQAMGEALDEAMRIRVRFWFSCLKKVLEKS